jgi:hypothetical protein
MYEERLQSNMSFEERRATPHRRTLRIAALIKEEERELCVVRNVSEGGMMLDIFSAVEPGQKIEVEVKNRHRLRGKVRWTADGRCGIAFDVPADVAQVLSNDVDKDAIRRTPRLEVVARARLRVGSRVYQTETIDISQGGARLSCSSQLPNGGEIVVTFEGMEPVPGAIRWYKDGVAAISFNNLLPVSRLARWLQERRRAA